MQVQRRQNTQEKFNERVVTINRVTKVVKGGRRFSFSALVVVGDGKGQVGVGTGKASEVPESINKATRLARKSFIKVFLKDQRTIPYEITGKFGASSVIMRPASAGTGVIAGGPVRAVLECIGVKDILTKRIGSRNPRNVVNATLNGLKQLILMEEHVNENKKFFASKKEKKLVNEKDSSEKEHEEKQKVKE